MVQQPDMDQLMAGRQCMEASLVSNSAKGGCAWLSKAALGESHVPIGVDSVGPGWLRVQLRMSLPGQTAFTIAARWAQESHQILRDAGQHQAACCQVACSVSLSGQADVHAPTDGSEKRMMLQTDCCAPNESCVPATAAAGAGGHLWRPNLHERGSGGGNAACSQNSLQLMLLPRRMQAAADARARVAADARRQAALQREAARKEARAREEADAMEHLRASKESIKGAASRVSSCQRL